MGIEVRSVVATPTAALFASGAGQPGMGSPLVIDESSDFAYYMRAGGTVAQIQGGSSGSLSGAWPVGSLYVSLVTTDPSVLFGFGTWAAIGEGKVLIGVETGTPAFSTVKASGGSLLVSSSGTISIPTFTGDNYTPSGTNAVAQFTPSGTNAVGLFVPAGTNAASVASGSVSVEYPTGVPTFAGTTASASVSVTWPAVPTYAGTPHRHELPIIHNGALTVRILPVATFGAGGVSRVPDVRATVTNVLISDVTNSGVVMLSNSGTSAGTISWPASVPSARVTGLVPGGVISWPATAPSAVFKTGTAAAQIFTGATGSVSGQVFTGITGTVSGQVFTGVAKAPTGTISKPSFVGDPTSVVQPFITCYFWERIA